MNAKQTAPLIVTLPAIAAAAPPLIIGGAIGLGIVLVVKWLLSDDDKEKKLETAPANAETEFRRKEAETAASRHISAEIPVKPAAIPIPSAPRVFVPPPAVPFVPKVSAPVSVPVAVAIPKIVTQALPSPIKKKFVTREDLAAVFKRGARALTRTATVAALKKLGFGKTAAYAALTPNGRFSAWLQFAPDGIITWTE
jgi:hypothetical protein